MTDRELLEWAAKAAGMDVRWLSESYYGPTMMVMEDESGGPPWNPLTDDGDALRLAVQLGLQYEFDCLPPTNNDATRKPFRVRVWSNGWQKEDLDDDAYAATRRAIVRAAAEIGKVMP